MDPREGGREEEEEGVEEGERKLPWGRGEEGGEEEGERGKEGVGEGGRRGRRRRTIWTWMICFKGRELAREGGSEGRGGG